MPLILNINVGVLGHVDSGKTSLAKALSTVASTASFDKNPQSKERGITLDLGFSSFVVDPIPIQFQDEKSEYIKMQYTLVDCPGHASLIKTIIGGAQIIDIMMLVVDIVKGVQTQTAECLVIGEITSDRLLIVLNKVDLIPLTKRPQVIEKMKKRLWKTLENSKFKNCPIVVVSANPDDNQEEEATPQGLEELISTLIQLTPTNLERQQRIKDNDQGGFLFAVDHCFAIRGQGTVLTGTILNGSVSIGDTIEIPHLKLVKKVKSMQMFRQPIQKASQGDRVGICVSQLEATLVERCLVCSPPGHVTSLVAGIICVNRIPYFRGNLDTKSKFHLTLGHETVMATVTLFASPHHQDKDFSIDQEFLYLDSLEDDKQQNESNEGTSLGQRYLFFELERPIFCPPKSLVIGSRLDSDIHSNSCRLAFHGRLLLSIERTDYKTSFLPNLKIFKCKSRSGQLERITDERTGIVRGLFKKETKMEAFQGLKIVLSSGQKGVIEGSFGQTGKCKISIEDTFPPELMDRYSGVAGKKKKNKASGEQLVLSEDKCEAIAVRLDFKRFIFDINKRMCQS